MTGRVRIAVLLLGFGTNVVAGETGPMDRAMEGVRSHQLPLNAEFDRLVRIRVGEIEEEFRQRLAGSYLDRDDRLVFLLRGGGTPPVRLEYFDGKPMEFAFREGIEYSSDELARIRDRNLDALKGECSGPYAGDASDIRTQEIVVYVIGTRVDADASNCHVPAEVEGVKVRIDLMPGPVIKHDAIGASWNQGNAGARCT